MRRTLIVLVATCVSALRSGAPSFARGAALAAKSKKRAPPPPPPTIEYSRRIDALSRKNVHEVEATDDELVAIAARAQARAAVELRESGGLGAFETS